MRSRGAVSTSCPRSRKACAVRSPSGAGRVTRSRTFHPTFSSRVEETGAGALPELTPGVRAKEHGIARLPFTLGVEISTAVGLGDQAAKMQASGTDGGM